MICVMKQVDISDGNTKRKIFHSEKTDGDNEDTVSVMSLLI